MSPFSPLSDPRPIDSPWAPMDWPVPAATALVGNAVRLDPVDIDQDAAELFAVLDRDSLWAHVPNRPADLPAFIAHLTRRASDPNWQVWVVRALVPVGDAGPGAIIGTSSYLDAHPNDAWLEVGWTMYRESVWASAVNPECKLLLLGHAFDVLGAGRVQLKTDIRNQRSQRAIDRLGARYEGTLRRHMRRDDGTIRDSVMFAITAEDWPQVRDGLHTRLGR